MKTEGLSTIAIIVIAASIILIGSFLYFNRLKQAGNEEGIPLKGFASLLKKEEEKEEAIPPATAVEQPQLQEIVRDFIDNFIKQSPPIFEDASALKALDLLSQKAHQSIEGVGPSPNAALVTFLGLSEAPDQGYSLDNVFEEKGTAVVETTWKYSSGQVKKTFHLVFENGSWKIDAIE